jgi:hypothetical protein
LFEIKTPQAGFCILNCDLAGFEKKEKKRKGEEKEKES